MFRSARFLPRRAAALTASLSGAAVCFAQWDSHNATKLAYDSPTQKHFVNKHGTEYCEAMEKAPGANKQTTFYTADDVAKHNSIENGVWVTFRDGVYDVTEFVKQHPGGADLILLAAGGPVENFWEQWAFHIVSAKAVRFLEQYCIGRLKDGPEGEDIFKRVVRAHANDPKRADSQETLVVHPFSSQTHPEVLAQSFLTPNDAFYVRNHCPVPQLPDDYEIGVGTDKNTSWVPLSELTARFPPHKTVSVMQCAGNRSRHMFEDNDRKETGFLGTRFEGIGVGMAGNAEWDGVRLSDVLRAYLPPEVLNNDQAHVVFEGADGYSSSTPLQRVLDPSCEAMIATKMNGETLPEDHGYPARVVIPGNAGARSVKWVSEIRVSEKECEGSWNKYYYQLPSGVAIQGLPLQSFFLAPTQLDSPALNQGCLDMQGVAYSGETGNSISRVEVSVDGGVSWHGADLKEEYQRGRGQKSWHWTRWNCSVPVAARGDVTIACRAFDSEGNVQPKDDFSPKGYCYSGWHRYKIHLSDRS